GGRMQLPGQDRRPWRGPTRRDRDPDPQPDAQRGHAGGRANRDRPAWPATVLFGPLAHQGGNPLLPGGVLPRLDRPQAREQRLPRRELGELGVARGAVREVGLERGAVLLLEQTKGVGAHVDVLVVAHGSTPRSARTT